MSKDAIDFFNNTLSSSLGDLISSIGESVGEAQAALDRGSLSKYLELYDADEDEMPDQVLDILRSIGYQPTFYTLPEIEVEAKVSLSMSAIQQSQPNLGSKVRMYGMPSNASNNNKFNIDVNAFATLKFKIVPVPSPEGLDARDEVPRFVGLTIDNAKKLAKDEDWKINIKGDNETITFQYPKEGSLSNPSFEILLLALADKD